ncbi:MAG: hypothetical protein AAB223_09515 [Pseudomonadota bacterium]
MTRAVLLFGFVAGLAALGPAEAAPVARQAIDDPWKICAAQAARQEAASSLPRHLLAAIGKAESGRFDEANRVNVAWPWTVTAEGEGRFFSSAAEALAEVRRLKARKVSNIDVGCMQVNLGYHGNHFASLEEAMDPVANTAYAARFLKSLRETSADWMEAAGRYHSSLPERNGPYRAKVARLWDETKRDEAKRPAAFAAAPREGRNMISAAGFAAAPAASARPAQGSPPRGANIRTPAAAPNSFIRPSAVPIDHARTALLNANFRAARERQGGESGAIVTGGVMPVGMRSHVDAAANRARMEAERIRAFSARDVAPGTPAAADRFAAKRTSSLARWRATRPGGESY